MKKYPCADSRCPNKVSKPGEYCHDCQRDNKKAETDYRHAGWSRQDEREELKHGAKK